VSICIEAKRYKLAGRILQWATEPSSVA